MTCGPAGSLSMGTLVEVPGSVKDSLAKSQQGRRMRHYAKQGRASGEPVPGPHKTGSAFLLYGACSHLHLWLWGLPTTSLSGKEWQLSHAFLGMTGVSTSAPLKVLPACLCGSLSSHMIICKH